MVDVSDGYARNFLLPRKLAVEANADNMNTMKLQEKARQAKLAEEKAQAQAVADQLKELTVLHRCQGRHRRPPVRRGYH